MITSIARRELLLQFRDGRLVTTVLLMLALIGSAVAVGWREHAEGERERALFAGQSYAQWLSQPPKHPHRAAAFGLYVAKPESPLAIFESGLRPHAGRTLWLEAHAQTAFSHAPADDDLAAAVVPGERSGAALLQLLGGLVALVLGALSIARERETGVLRQILAQHGSPVHWVAGKYVGLAMTLAIALGPLAIAVTAVLLAGASPAERGDVMARAAVGLAGNSAYLLAMLAVGMAVSMLVQSSRAALIIALSLWVAGSLLAPRVAAHLAVTLAPTPDAAAYQRAIGAEFASGHDGQPGFSERLRQLQEDTLAEHGIDNLDDLPIGFSGLRMKLMTAWSDEVSDRHYARLQAIYDRQERMRMVVAALAPVIAARAYSHAAAGMDWSHYQHFADAAEVYRRDFNLVMNDLIVRGTRGQAWDMDADRDDWALVEPFHYTPPDVGFVLQAAAVPASILLAWLLSSLLVLGLAARRLRP
jgi:ABC-2 type transport system permease protein